MDFIFIFKWSKKYAEKTAYEREKAISKVNGFNETLDPELTRKANKKWNLYLYLNGQCIDKRKIDKDFAPMGKFYIVKVRGMKHLLGTNRKVQIVVQSYKYKLTDENKREAHIETLIYEGVDIK